MPALSFTTIENLVCKFKHFIRRWAFRRFGVREIHIPDGMEELCDACFTACKSLSRVTFSDSSVKLLGKEALRGSGVGEIHITA